MLEYLIGIHADGKQVAVEAGKAAQSLGSVENAAVRMGSRLAAIFGGDQLLRMARQTIELGASHDRMAKQLGISIESAQAFAYAAKQGDTSIQSVASAIRFLSRAMAEAGGKGSGEAFDAFARFKVSLDEIRGLSADQMLLRIADQFAKMPDSVRKTTDTITLLGRGADELFPAFKDGFSKVAAEAKNLGLVLSDGAIANLAEAESILKDVDAIWETIKQKVLSSKHAMDALRAAGEAMKMGSETSSRPGLVSQSAVRALMVSSPSLALGAGLVQETSRYASSRGVDAPLYQTVSLLRQILKEVDQINATANMLF